MPSTDKCLTADDYETYREPIKSFLYAQLGRSPGGPVTLDDLTAQVFCRALYAQRRGNGAHSNLNGWLYTIAKSVILDHLRSKQREPIFEPLSSLSDSGLSLHSHQDVEKSVLFSLEIEEILSKLEPYNKQLIQRTLEGYTPTEIAQAENSNRLCIQQRIQRIRRRLNRHRYQRYDTCS